MQVGAERGRAEPNRAPVGLRFRPIQRCIGHPRAKIRMIPVEPELSVQDPVVDRPLLHMLCFWDV